MHTHSYEDRSALFRDEPLQASREGKGEEACNRCGIMQASQDHLLGSQGREGVKGEHESIGKLMSGSGPGNWSAWSGFVSLIEVFPENGLSCAILRVVASDS